MTKFNIPAITRPIELAEYDEAMQGGVIHTWVNPTRQHVRDLDAIRIDTINVQTRHLKFQQDVAGASDLQRDAVAKQREMLSAELEAILARQYAWYAATWSKNAETWTADELQGIAETDPALWQWLCERTQTLIVEHREGRQKN